MQAYYIVGPMATYRQTSNIRRTLGDEIIGRPNVVGASPVSILHLTGVNGLGKVNCKTRRETLKIGDSVRLI